MDNEEIKELLKKCFGKQKDDKYHGIAMLIIYGVFIFVLVLVIRISGSANLSVDEIEPIDTIHPTTVPTSSPDVNNDTIDSSNNMSVNDVNYSYSYTIVYNGITEVFLGKKVNDKEKFTYVKDNTITEYAILNGNYLVLSDGHYHISDKPSRFLKYCDIEKILLLSNKKDNLVSSFSNEELISVFGDSISIPNDLDNSVKLTVENETLKQVDLDFTNYISAVQGTNLTLTIHMEFAEVGTTEDFEINLS